ncbi:MAG TPA: response regulator transcription factor [Vicinamibacterales bacterium]|nr:response regulator transcription factor [Vicinamibacterales bacterium]
MTSVFIVGRTAGDRRAVRARLEAGGLALEGDGPLIDDALESGASVIVVLEIDPLEARRRGRELPPVLILSDDDGAASRAAAAGASIWGVVPTEATPSELVAAVNALAAGLAVAPPALLATMARTRSEAGPDDGEEAGEWQEHLTPRERHVLELVAEGRSNRAIAEALGISEHTVKFHLASIYGKLGASTRTEAVRRGLRRGLITI